MELILTHNFSDFDAVASQLAAAKLYRDAVPLLSGQLNDNVAEFIGLHRDELPFVRRADLPKELAISRLILVDTDRVQGQLEVPERTPAVIVDHHPLERELQPWEQGIFAEVGATATILLQRLREGSVALSGAEATLLLLGIYEDTGSFAFEGTTPADFHSAAWLLDQGADLSAVSRYLHRPLTEGQEQVYHRLLEVLRIEEMGGWPVLLAELDLETHVPGLAALAHTLRDIYEPAALLLCLGVAGSGTQLIARSNGEALNVGEIAQRLGGGGHPVAAAAFVRERPVGEVALEVEQLARALIRPVLRAAEIMSSPPQTIAVGASMAEAAERLHRTGYSALPVVDERGRPVGLIGRRELDKALRHGLSGAGVSTYMWKGLTLASPETPVAELRGLMARDERGRILVVAEERLAGLITRGDLLRHTEPGGQVRPHGLPLAERLEQVLPAQLSALLRTAGAIAAEQGWSLYLVGGPVRDLLLDRPVLDLDLVVEGQAIALASAVAERYGAGLRCHEQFGTATVLLEALEPARHVDFVTARIEFYEHPTALPEVEAASLRHDLHRRDFTINTLALRLNPDHYGRLYDFYGGRRDLERRLIRVLHNLSFIDDPTRILRAARLAARLGFAVEPRTQALIVDALGQDVLSRTTPERIRHELRRTLDEALPERPLRLMEELGILAALHPGLRLGPALDERFAAAREQGLELPAAYLLLLLYDLSAEERAALASRYQLTARQRLLLHELGLCRAAVPALRANRLGDGALDALLHGREPLALEVLALVEGGRVASRVQRYQQKLRSVATLLNGRDLQALGLTPGPLFAPLLRDLRVAQLDGRISSREEAAAWIRQTYSERA